MLTPFEIYQCGPGNEDAWTYEQQLAFGRAVEGRARAQALREAYDLMFDVKGCKVTRFDAQTAIRNLAAPEDVQAWHNKEVPHGTPA